MTEKVDFEVISKEESLWSKVVDNSKKSIANISDALTVEKGVLETAEKKVAILKEERERKDGKKE